jgi:hypothetical protein
MLFRRFSRLLTRALVLGIATCLSISAQTTHRGRKYKTPPPTSRVEVTVLRADDQKPVENAAVVFQLEGDKGNMELKTDEDGKAMIDVLPTGSKVLLQVLAKGYQTYGTDYTLDKAEMTLEVKLKRPGKQYSIYENHPDQGAQVNGEGKDKPSDANKDSKDSPKSDPPSQSANQPGAKPDSNPPQPQ